MGKVTGDDIHYKLEEINSILGKQYVLKYQVKERDWKNYERKVTKFGSGAKVDCPKEFLGRRVYLIITRDEE